MVASALKHGMIIEIDGVRILVSPWVHVSMEAGDLVGFTEGLATRVEPSLLAEILLTNMRLGNCHVIEECEPSTAAQSLAVQLD